MQTIFSTTVVGSHSLGSNYSRYYQVDLPLTSGIQIAAGARINSVTFRCSNITVWSSNVVDGAHLRLDGVDFTTAQWAPRGDNQNLLKSCSTTTSIYAGKTTFSFFCGWDSTPTGTAWCSYRHGGALTLTIDWDATDDINTYTQDVTAGTAASVTINNSGYSHTAVWAFGTHSTSVPMAAGVTSASFNFPVTWLDVIPNSMTGTGTLTLITLSGSVEIGRVSRSVTFRCPASPPLLTNLSDGATGKYGAYYLKGVTSLSPTVSAAAQYFASVASVVFNLSSGIIGATGTYTLTATVIDSRGQSASLSGSPFTVKEYALPVLTIDKCNRSTAAGVDADDGTAVKAQATAATTTDGYTNPLASLTFASKLADDDDFGAEQALTNGVQAIMTYRTFNTTNTYDVRFTATDTVGGATSIVVRINVTGYKMYLRSDGTGVAFGKACEHQNALEIPQGWDIYQGSTRLVDIIYPVGSIYMSTTATSPAVLFGTGTWERIEDTFLLAAGSHAAGSTGGEENHTITQSEVPSYCIGNIPAVVMGYHNRWTNYGVVATDLGTIDSYKTGVMAAADNYVSSGNQFGWSLWTNGGGQSHNNMPPYIAVYVWKRTA